MSTEQATEVVYDEFELAVLQAHLDMYRALPECTSLISLPLIHRFNHAKACLRLKERGMMEVTSYEGENLYDYVCQGDTLFDELQKKGERPYWIGRKFAIRYISEFQLPGLHGQLRDKAPEEMVRLYKAGILKKND